MSPIVVPDHTGGGDSVAIGDRARAGSLWMITATGAAKGIGFVCQFALAWFMTRKEFGVFAIAVSLSVLLSVLRDGGLPVVLIEKARRFNLFAGPVFWMMVAINMATGLAIGLIARPAAALYHEPELAAVIMLFAVTIPLCVPASILSLRLSTELRFRELGLVQLLSAITRNILLLGFAWSGFGARSFILPLLITNVTDGIFLWYLTRFSPWTMSPRFRLWPTLIRSGRWVLLGTFAIALGNNGAYFALGKILPSEVVGTYFFAYQLVVQLGTLLSDNVYQVLFAAFARMGRDVSRLHGAVLRSLKVVALLGAVASLAIAAVYQPVEQTLWHGKWSGAAQAIQVLAIVWPAAAAVSVLRALQAATGRFRQWGCLTLITAVISVTGTVMGAALGGSASDAALGFGAGTLLGAALNARFALAPLDITVTAATSVVMRPWLVVVAATIFAELIGRLAVSPIAAIALTAACFCAAVLVGVRFFAKDSLQLLESSLRQIIAARLTNRPATAPAS